MFQLEEFPIRPVSVRGRCYRRVGTANRVMTPHEIGQMHLVASGSTWDTLPATDAAVKDLDLAKVRRYVRAANATGRRNIDSREPLLTTLTKLELVKRNHPTWAAILLFGKAPQEKLGQAAVHCGRFKAEVLIIDDKMVRGTLTDQVDEVMAFAVIQMKEKHEITNHEYQLLNGVSRVTATRELHVLLDRGVLMRHGKVGRGTKYSLKGGNAP